MSATTRIKPLTQRPAWKALAAHQSTVGFYPIAKPPPPAEHECRHLRRSRCNRFLKHAPVKTPTTKKNISNALRLRKVRL